MTEYPINDRITMAKPDGFYIDILDERVKTSAETNEYYAKMNVLVYKDCIGYIEPLILSKRLIAP